MAEKEGSNLSQVDLTGSIDLFKSSANESEDMSDDNMPLDLYGGSESEEEVEEEASEEETEDGEEEAEDEDEDEEVEEDEEEEKEVKAKTVKIKSKGEEVEIALDAKIPVKINGEIKQVKLSDLQAEYSSKSARVQELEEIKSAKVEIEAEKYKIHSELEERELEIADKQGDFDAIASAVKKGDIETVITAAAIMGDVNPADLWDRIDEIFSDYYPKFANLTPAEKRSIQLDRRNKLRDVVDGYAQEKNGKKAAVQEFRTFKDSIQKNTNLSNDEVHKGWVSLENKAKSGELTPEQIANIQKMNPKQRYQIAAAEALANKTSERIKGIVSSKFSRLQNQTKEIIGKIEKVMGVEYLLKATDKNIEDLINSVYNDNNATNRKKSDATISKKDKLSDKASPRHNVSKKTAPADEEESDEDADYDDIYNQESSRPASQVWGSAFSKNLK